MVNDELKLSIVIARCEKPLVAPTGGGCILTQGLPPDITIAVRMDSTQTGGCSTTTSSRQSTLWAAELRLTEENGLSIDAYRFDDLDDLLRPVGANAFRGGGVMDEPDHSIELIPIDQITLLNPRARSRRNHREIIDNIETVGLKRPITVSRRQVRTLRATTLCAERAASRPSGRSVRPEIPAIVLEPPKRTVSSGASLKTLRADTTDRSI